MATEIGFNMMYQMDPVTAGQVMDVLIDEVRAQGPGALIVTRDPGAAVRADRTITVRNGRVT